MEDDGGNGKKTPERSEEMEGSFRHVTGEGGRRIHTDRERFILLVSPDSVFPASMAVL